MSRLAVLRPRLQNKRASASVARVTDPPLPGKRPRRWERGFVTRLAVAVLTSSAKARVMVNQLHIRETKLTRPRDAL